MHVQKFAFVQSSSNTVNLCVEAPPFLAETFFFSLKGTLIDGKLFNGSSDVTIARATLLVAA